MRKGTKLIIALVVVLAMSWAIVGCQATTTTTIASSNTSSSSSTDGTTTSAKKLKIAYIAATYTDEGYKWQAAKTKEYCEELGYDFVDYDANGDVQKQINFISDAISAGCDGVVLSPADNVALAAGCKKAQEAGVVVSLIACDLAPAQQQYRDFFCGPNDTEAGKLAGETIIKQFPNGAKGVMVMGGAGDDAATKREAGFEEAIKGSNIELLDKQSSPWDVQKAMSITEDFITKYGDKIQFVYSHWDNGSVGVVQALEAKNMLDKVFIISVDGCRAGVNLVKDGKIANTIYQDFGLQARNCVDAITTIKNGGKLTESIKHVPWTLITKESANFDPGW